MDGNASGQVPRSTSDRKASAHARARRLAFQRCETAGRDGFFRHRIDSQADWCTQHSATVEAIAEIQGQAKKIVGPLTRYAAGLLEWVRSCRIHDPATASGIIAEASQTSLP